MMNGFTDSNNESLNERGANFSYDQKIHWLKHWFPICERNESQSRLNDSLTFWKKEERISAMTKRFTHSKSQQMQEQWISAMTKWFPRYMWEEWISFMTEWFTDSLNDTGMNLGHELKKIRWSKHRVAEQDRNEFQAYGKGFTNANLGSASTQLQTHNSWTFQNSDRTTVCINYVRQV